MIRKDIKNFTLEELKKEMKAAGEPAYRAKQIFSWLYKKGKTGFGEMINMPEALKEKLEDKYCIGNLDLAQQLKSSDGTRKFLFKLKDGNFIETVLIYAKDRKTACISTQVGCKYGCTFCASGLRGFVRDLEVSEITKQILFLQFNLKHALTNIVFMGMGEPLDNYENVSKAVTIMTSPDGMNIGAGRITISTCGIVPGIKALKGLKSGINLSVSLHAANDRLRNTIMPVNKKYPLRELLEACSNFLKAKKGALTFEYVLIKGRNDSMKDAEELAAVARKFKAKVNLLVYSMVQQLDLKPPGTKEAEVFMKWLIDKNIKVTLRRSKGADIAAACGQLAGYDSK